MKMPSHHAIAADFVFDGSAMQRNAAIVIDNARIAAIKPRGDLAATMPTHNLPDGVWLAPGFIDIQVNGGGDVLFNDTPTAAGIRTIAAAHRRFGTTSFLPTLISDTPEKMKDALDAVAAADEPGVLGIHLEGPFLSPEKPGVHDPRHFRKPTIEDDALILAPRPGVTLVTLAPERVPAGFVRQLAQAGIRVSLGHSMASYDETRAAIAEGLTGFTHLFNAMRQLESREPGPIAAALEVARRLFRHDRGQRACRSGDAACGFARRGAADAGDRRDAAGRRAAHHLHAVWRRDHGLERTLSAQRRHACRRRA